MNQSDFGKLLVVDKRCKLTIKEIKDLTKSKFAKQLKLSDSNNLVRTLQGCLYVVNENNDFRSIKVYQLDTDAVSILLSMKDDYFITAIELNAMQLNEIGCYVEVINAILMVSVSAIDTMDYYSNLELSCNALNIDTKSLSGFAPSINAYNEAEIDANAIEQNLIAKIKEILRPTW